MEEDLHHHLEQVLFTQLEKQLFHIKSTQKHESKRFERLNSQLQLTRHQLEIYSDEAKQIQEALTRCVESFTKET